MFMSDSELSNQRRTKLNQLLTLATSAGLISTKQIEIAQQLIGAYEEGVQLVSQAEEIHPNDGAIEMVQCPHCRCVFTTKGEVTL